MQNENKIIAQKLTDHVQMPLNEGPDKRMSLQKAVALFVKPGMTLHFGVTHALPRALTTEVIRQFWKKDAQFTVITLGSEISAICMIKGEMVKKLITSYSGDIYPTPGPNRVFNETYLSKQVEFENWTVLTLPLRLMAGALGVGFLPTHSLIGSSMAEENQESLKIIDDPFGTDRQLCLVKELRPDLTMVHAMASDPAGNALFSPPLSEELWGAMGAKEGVIISTEHIVTTEFVRQHANQCLLPGSYVKAVCSASFGSHPSGVGNRGLEMFEPYSEDYDFIVDFRNASKEDRTLDEWIGHWLLSCDNHEEYLEKLSHERLLYLRGRGAPEAWQEEFVHHLGQNISFEPVCNPMELMTLTACNLIIELVEAEGYDKLLAGIGNANLAAWLAYNHYKPMAKELDIVAEIGMLGYDPRPGNPFVFSFHNLPTAKMLTASIESLGVFVSGPNSRCLGCLSAGQVDRFGNVNSTKIPDVYYLVGSGGANDIMSAADSVILTVPQEPLRFVEKVPYITGPGKHVRYLVSTMGVFAKREPEEDLTLVACLPDYENNPLEARVEKIRAYCGWKLNVADDLRDLGLPSKDDLFLLRMLDPRQAFTRWKNKAEGLRVE